MLIGTAVGGLAFLVIVVVCVVPYLEVLHRYPDAPRSKAEVAFYSPPLRAFLVSGADRVGAGANLMAKLAAKRINVIAIDAVCAGSGRYGAILWVSPTQYGKAARVLRVR